MTSTWEKLSKIDVNEHIKKKGNLTYLSWAWAWGELKDVCPTASFEKHFFDGLPYARDSQGFCYVQVSVTVENQTLKEVYPITDHKNTSIKNPNSFDVNTALQRCLTKAIAYHGLGHYIYAGEDLPEDAEPAEPQPAVTEKPEPPNVTFKQPPSPDAVQAEEGKPPCLLNKNGTLNWAGDQIEGFEKHPHLGHHQAWKELSTDDLKALATQNPEAYQLVVKAYQKRKSVLTNGG